MMELFKIFSLPLRVFNDVFGSFASNVRSHDSLIDSGKFDNDMVSFTIDLSIAMLKSATAQTLTSGFMMRKLFI